MRILIVEDEQMLREGLVDLLEGDGHDVVAAADGQEGVDLGVAQPFDMVILDLMLPRLSGFEVCERLRLARPRLPILMLTAKGSEADKVTGLELGADDYVTKPFGVRELLARVHAFGRRAEQAVSAPERLEAFGVVMDLGRCLVERDGLEQPLTAREVGLLRWLHAHRARAVHRGELLEHVWGLSPDIETRTIDVTVGNLRRKIEPDPREPRIVISVKGVGYAWGPDA